MKVQFGTIMRDVQLMTLVLAIAIGLPSSCAVRLAARRNGVTLRR
jgi:hypothetical protein